jgi:hypothetical protein
VIGNLRLFAAYICDCVNSFGNALEAFLQLSRTNSASVEFYMDLRFRFVDPIPDAFDLVFANARTLVGRPAPPSRLKPRSISIQRRP